MQSNSQHPKASTLGQLRASGHVYRSVKQEIRDNLLARMRAGQDRFPGIVGFDQTVLPHVERALLAGHDVILLGERGQGKTRLIRTLATLLDDWSPVVAGCEINDHPYQPACSRCQRLAAELGDDLPVTWRPPTDRYGEKLATPDTSVGDLIGDIDPVKVAEGRTLGDPETIHFGLVPRTNRGIFSLNELPDLAERIQVALLNVLEERDIGVRGYALRLPLDIVLVASANPEDYTNRGRIITPLKDRFGAEVRTHYPLSLDSELDLIAQEAEVSWGGKDPGAVLPAHITEIIARFTRLVRESPAVDSRSGVSARFAIAAAESAAAAAVRRSALAAEPREELPVARVCDLPTIVSTLRGKVEFEVSEEGREEEVLAHLLRRATAETFRARLGGADLSGLLDKFADGTTIISGELVPAGELLRRTGEVPGLAKIMERLGMEGGESFGEAAAAIEFALEGLYLLRRLSKDSSDGLSVYGQQLSAEEARKPMANYRYGEYDGGPDPLGSPYDVREALDEMGDSILSGGSPLDALRELLRRGWGDRRGLDDLLRRVRDRQRNLRRSGRLDGMLEQARALLDTAVGQERAELFPDPSDEARMREADLDSLPSDPSQAIQQLADYDWRSPAARETFDRLRDLLRREVLDSQFRGMKEALENPDPAAMQRVKDMLASLRGMLDADARGEHTPADFDEFMSEFGDMFPDNPQNLEELVDSLVRRMMAAERLLSSLSPEQREELANLMAQAMEDAGLAAEMAALADALRGRRPELGRPQRGVRMSGEEPLGLGDATSAVGELADLADLENALSQDYAGASLDDVDEEAISRALGRQAVDDIEALRQVERELERQGYLTRSGGNIELTPKAVRRLGDTALRRVFAGLENGARNGDHDRQDAGQAGELTGATREWEFGDEQPIDVPATVRAGLMRTAAERAADTAAPRGRVKLSPRDFQVAETERRSAAAVCLLVDLSYSMALRGTWAAAKQTALALHALLRSKYPQDAIQVVGFSDYARELHETELAGLGWHMVQGTNLHHALMLAGRHLDKHPDHEPVVLIVTDGEPTAHLQRNGQPFFDWPPSPETVALTLAEVDKMTRRKAALNIFMLAEDDRLSRFVDNVAKRNGGRVLRAAPERLGEYVVSDFLRTRGARGTR